MKQRENDYPPSNVMMDSYMHDMSSGESDLAQLAAMSEMNSAHGQGASDYMQLSGSSFGLPPYSDYPGAHGSGSPLRAYLGSLSSLSGASSTRQRDGREIAGGFVKM